MKLKKILSKEAFIYDQFVFLKDSKSFKENNKYSNASLDKAIDASVSSIIMMGYPAVICGDEIEVSGDDMGISESFKAKVSGVEIFCGKELIENIKNGTAVFNYVDDISDETKPADQAVVSLESTERVPNDDVPDAETIEVCAPGESPVTETNEAVNNSETAISSVNITDAVKSEDEKPALPYGLLEEDESVRENDTEKYLSTMWFNTHLITCQNKNSEYGLNIKTFKITVYPLMGPDEKHPSIPVRVMACITNEEENRNVVVFPSDNYVRSVRGIYDNYVFNITGRFTDKGFRAMITLDVNTEYLMIEDDDEYAVVRGKYLPKSFCKTVTLGPDKVELYPISLNNDEISGCVQCAYRHITPTSDIEVDISKDQFIITDSEGTNHQLFNFWVDDKFVCEKAC